MINQLLIVLTFVALTFNAAAESKNFTVGV
jgi:hypothetical protein